MSIRVPPADPLFTDRALSALRAIQPGTAATGIATRADDDVAERAIMVEPIPVYAPNLEAKDYTAAAAQTGWRYLVAQSEEIGAVDVRLDGLCEPAIINDANVAERIAKASLLAERIISQNGEYEMRILDLSIFGRSLLWFQSENSADRYFTFDDEPTEINAQELRRNLVRWNRALRTTHENDDHESGG